MPFLRDSPQIVQSAVMACVKPILCCAKDYLVIEGQVLHNIFLVASGAVEVINSKGLVSRTYGIGSFFGEKCAFHAHYLSSVSYRAKVELEVLTIDRNSFVDLLNTYEEFASTFVMICEKREDVSSNKFRSSELRSLFTSLFANSDIIVVFHSTRFARRSTRRGTPPGRKR